MSSAWLEVRAYRSRFWSSNLSLRKGISAEQGPQDPVSRLFAQLLPRLRLHAALCSGGDSRGTTKECGSGQNRSQWQKEVVEWKVWPEPLSEREGVSFCSPYPLYAPLASEECARTLPQRSPRSKMCQDLPLSPLDFIFAFCLVLGFFWVRGIW